MIELPLSDPNRHLECVLLENEIATWTWDIVNDRVVADYNLNRLFGLSSGDGGGEPIEVFVRLIHSDDRKRVHAAIAATLRGPNDKFEADYRIVRADGTTSWVSARGKVERDANGRPQNLPGVMMDVTQRKEFETRNEEFRSRLDQQTRLFDTTLSSITDFVYIFDRDGRFVYVNQALLDLWGLKIAEAVGKNFHELKYPKDLAERLQRQIQQVIDTKKGILDETPYTSPTGAGGYYEYIFRPVFDADGNVSEVAGSTRDITERKRVEEELRRSQDRYRALAETLEIQVRRRTIELEERNDDVLKQSEKLRDLSVNLMETQDQERRRIARELHDSAGQTIALLLMSLGEIRKEIRTNNPRLARLADEALQYADALNQEVRTTSYLLHPPLLDEIGLGSALAWYVDGLKERAGLDIALHIDADFVRPSRELELTIFRIVQECLTNIHRHSGSKTALIKISSGKAGVEVEVRDSGRGIDADNLAKIHASGGGVGLRGLRERVRRFKGDLGIDSRLGFGTTIVVRLPLSNSALIKE